MQATLTFSCTHVCPQFERTGATATAAYDPDFGWSATARGFGCSKGASTPEAALRGMLLEHDCDHIAIARTN